MLRSRNHQSQMCLALSSSKRVCDMMLSFPNSCRTHAATRKSTKLKKEMSKWRGSGKKLFCCTLILLFHFKWTLVNFVSIYSVFQSKKAKKNHVVNVLVNETVKYWRHQIRITLVNVLLELQVVLASYIRSILFLYDIDYIRRNFDLTVTLLNSNCKLNFIRNCGEKDKIRELK